MDIRAAILWEQRQPLSVEAAVLDPPGPGEVLVEMQAAGVCHSDLHPARGDWPAKTPVVLGHEGAGIVREVGPSVTRVVSHTVDAGRPATSAPRLTPSTANCTAATPACAGAVADTPTALPDTTTPR